MNKQDILQKEKEEEVKQNVKVKNCMAKCLGAII